MHKDADSNLDAFGTDTSLFAFREDTHVRLHSCIQMTSLPLVAFFSNTSLAANLMGASIDGIFTDTCLDEFFTGVFNVHSFQTDALLLATSLYMHFSQTCH
jgi:hypothetical protein